MTSFVGDEPGKLENRRAERITAHFSVTFREISDTEAELLSAGDGDLHGELPPLPAPSAAPAPLPAGAEAPGPARSENLSQGGLSFSGDLQLLGSRRLDKGKKLLVEFNLPGESRPVRALAVVAWSIQGSGEHGKFTAGLMFLGIGEADLDKIQGYISKQAPPA
jgi:hypothetical protein